jgi:hypothetical protein
MYSHVECDGSFVKMSSREVQARAEESYWEIKKRKKEAVQRLINKRKEEILKDREKKRNSFWSRIFGYKERLMPTDEEIQEALESYSGEFLHFPETHWIDLRYEKYVDVALRLMNAAKYSEEVYVSTTDLERLLRCTK